MFHFRCIDALHFTRITLQNNIYELPSWFSLDGADDDGDASSPSSSLSSVIITFGGLFSFILITIIQLGKYIDFLTKIVIVT